MRNLLVIALFGIGSSLAHGQVVQLPSISTFYYSGTVVVPDGGTASLGGIRSAASQSRQRGFRGGFGSSPWGASQATGQASVSATIIDLDAIDRQVRGEMPLGSDSSRSSPAQRDTDGKALVRHARRLHAQGNVSAAFRGYQAAIEMLSPSLRSLARAEFKRVFGAAAEQALSVSAVTR